MDHEPGITAASRIDPVCGMVGSMEHEGRWFCSRGCIAEFARRGTKRSPLSRLRDPWVWVPVSGLLVATAGWWAAGLPFAAAAQRAGAIYLAYLHKVLAPALIGLVLGGAIEYFIPKEYIIKFLSGSRKRVILRSALLGFLSSTCSHGCLALSIELYRKGASIPAVVSFLLASPWASMSLTLILLGLFGPAKGLVIIGGAILIAIAAGLIFQRLARRGLIDTNPNTQPLAEGYSIRRDLAARWRGRAWTLPALRADAAGIGRGMIPLGRMVLGWVQLGLLLSAVLGSVISGDALHRLMGPSAGGLLLTMGAAAVIEVCSEGTAPLAFELYRHTGALGNAFAFLMGGVVTDYTELAAVWNAIGRRTVLWLLAVTLPMVFAVGLLLNFLRG